MNFIKNGCTSKFSQLSGFQIHLWKQSNFNISICQTQVKKNSLPWWTLYICFALMIMNFDYERLQKKWTSCDTFGNHWILASNQRVTWSSNDFALDQNFLLFHPCQNSFGSAQNVIKDREFFISEWDFQFWIIVADPKHIYACPIAL